MQLRTASSQKWAPSVASMGSNRARWPVSRLSLWHQPVAAPEEDFLTSHYFKTHLNCNVCNLTAAGLLLGCFPCESQFAVVFNIKIFSVKLTGVTCDCKRELNCFSSLLCIRRIIYCNLLKTENKTGSLCGSGRWSRSVVGICFRREQDSLQLVFLGIRSVLFAESTHESTLQIIIIQKPRSFLPEYQSLHFFQLECGGFQVPWLVTEATLSHPVPNGLRWTILNGKNEVGIINTNPAPQEYQEKDERHWKKYF